MRSVFVLLSTFLVIHCSCPDGFDLVRNGQCRGNYTTMVAPHDEATPTAIAKCKEIQGLPVIMSDEEDQTYWSNLVPDNGQYIVLGLVCNSISKKWEWADGSPQNFMPNTFDPTLEEDCDTTISWYMRHDGYWSGGNYDKNITIYICCSTQLEQPVPSGDGCDGFEDDSEDGVCYQIGTSGQTWQNAQMICQNVGANLASIHSLNENSFLRRLAVSKGVTDGLFLGATKSGKGKDYGWIDGSDWDYDHFYNGFPSAGFGDCVVMDTQAASGEWINTNCSSNFSVACIRKAKVPTCSEGPWKEGQIITSPGFPFDSSIPCDYLLEVEAGKKVEVEIVMLEANSCCDNLILFENHIGENIIADLTGEISNKTYTTSTSNLMRVSWLPNGGVNVSGIMMSFRAV